MAIYDKTGISLLQAFDTDGTELSTAYDKDGGVVFSPEPYNPQLSFFKSILMSDFNPNKMISPQGMAVYGDYIAQYFTNDDSLRLINMTNWSIDGAYEIPEFVHGNGLVFGKVVQQSGFPLLYASQFGTVAPDESKLIAIAEIGLSSYSIKEYYDIPRSAGYHPQFVADWDNNKAYAISYPQASTGTGSKIVAEFDIHDMDTIIDQWTISSMGIIQGSCFWNGYIVVIVDSYDYAKVGVNFINVATHQNTEIQFTKQQNRNMEFQGVDVVGGDLLISSWIYDANDNNVLKYWLYKLNLPSEGQTIETHI